MYAEKVPSPEAPAPQATPASAPSWRIPYAITWLAGAILLLGRIFALVLAAFPTGHLKLDAFLSSALIETLWAIPIAFIAGVTTLVMFHRAEVKPRTKQRFVAWVVALSCGALMALAGVGIVLLTLGGGRGRQIRRRGKVLLPDVEPGDTWSTLPFASDVPPELRAPLAAQWRENGRTEHASVAAFARLTLDLMALGAPPKLLRDAQRDAEDEIRHAELCFSLARTLDGSAESPAAFPKAARARTLSRFRTLALAQLAVDSLVDGALHEGVSARVIAQLVQRCEHPEVRALLKELAADEGRHCAHGWDVLEWCLAEGGWKVERALAGALKMLPRTHRSSVDRGAEDGGWERFGIPGSALEAEQYAKARAEIVRRVERLRAAPPLYSFA